MRNLHEPARIWHWNQRGHEHCKEWYQGIVSRLSPVICIRSWWAASTGLSFLILTISRASALDTCTFVSNFDSGTFNTSWEIPSSSSSHVQKALSFTPLSTLLPSSVSDSSLVQSLSLASPLLWDQASSRPPIGGTISVFRTISLQ